MLKDNFFICFGEDWGRHPTSTQHLIREFSKYNHILWVNSVSTRLPRLSLYDLNRIFVKFKEWRTQPQQKELNNLKIVSPLAIPAHQIRIFRMANKFLLFRQISKRIKEPASKKPILWLSGPSVVDMLGRFNEVLSIYYCGDEFSEYPGVSKKTIIEMERELLSRADLVIVSSEKLYQAKRIYNKNTFIITHGVDFEHFERRNYINKPIPEELKGIKKPIIGFYGLIENWVDLDLFEHLARNKPEWSLVLIGKSIVSLKSLKKYSNIHFLGPINYQKLPQYSLNFDAALMPFKINELTIFVNPLKMFEYMASGLPIVSTHLPELDKYSKIVKLAASKEEFLEKINECLEEKDKSYILEGIKIASKETWQKKAEAISSLIETRLPEGVKK